MQRRLSPAPGQPPVLSVSDLNRLARETLEQSFPLLWVAGEISNLTRAASGHWYFSLKDGKAQVRCAMFRSRNAALDWVPREGDHVEARALVTLYEARGEFQLTVEALRRAGLGALFEAFERLKAKLEAEGLFDAVLVDVPCSNTGVLARRPEARYRFTQSTLDKLVALQRTIIEQTVPLLAPTAHLLYATCSLEREENHKQAAWITQHCNLTLQHESATLPSSRGQPYHDGSYHALLAAA